MISEMLRFDIGHILNMVWERYSNPGMLISGLDNRGERTWGVFKEYYLMENKTCNWTVKGRERQSAIMV